MIRIGFNNIQKQSTISEYLKNNKIEKVYVFYFKKFKPNFEVDCEIEYIEYAAIEMYKYFYRLIEEIDNNSLLIFDECMRTQNRNELIYNCAHHYCNQTQHKIVFEYFPIIDDVQNIMILFDFINKGKYKGKSFNIEILKDIDVKSINRVPDLKLIDLKISEIEVKAYEKEKDKLFNNLEKKHPDTISTALELFVGKFKKSYIESDKKYIARNSRFKKDNISTFKEATEKNLIMIDFPTRQIDLNDYIKRTLTNELTFINSTTKVDSYYISEYERFKKECEQIYAKTSI